MLEWAFKLRDDVTRPAGSIETQLKRVSFALKTLDIASKQARLDRIVDPLKKTRLELQLHRDRLMLSKRAQDEHTRSNKSFADSLLKWAGSLYILDVLARGFRAVGRAASAMGEEVKDAVETRQRGLFGLRATMGNQAGASFFEQLQRQAQAYGRPPGEIVGMGASFAEQGVSTDDARRLVAVVSDVRARSGGRTDIAGQVRELLLHPRAQLGAVEGLGQAFRPNALLQAIGRRQGVGTNPEDVRTLLGRNAITRETVMAALQDVDASAPGARGQVGGMATRFAGGTLEGSIGRVTTAWQKLLGSLENSQGVKTLQTVLQNLAATLGGAKVQAALVGLANTLGEALKPLTGPDGKKNMEAFFVSMAASIEKVLPGLASIAKALGWTAGMTAKGWGLLLGGGAANGMSVREITGEEGTLPGGAKTAPPIVGFGMTGRQPITVTVHAPVSMRFDGVSQPDAHALTRSFADQLSTALGDALEQLGTQQGDK